MRQQVLSTLLIAALAAGPSAAIAASQSPQGATGPSESAPGPSMKETEAWIKRELPKMGRDLVVESNATLTKETRYEITRANLSECTLKVESKFQWMIAPNSQSETVTVPMKAVDLSRLVAVETTTRPDSTASKPSYIVRLVALPDRSMPRPFDLQRNGTYGGVATGPVAAVNVRLRDIGLANQAAAAFRRAALLCGAPDRSIDASAMVSCHTMDWMVFCARPPLPSASAPRAALPEAKATQAMTNSDVIQMVAAGLSDTIVAAAVRQAASKSFDLTTAGLIALKGAKVSDAVILAMQGGL